MSRIGYSHGIVAALFLPAMLLSSMAFAQTGDADQQQRRLRQENQQRNREVQQWYRELEQWQAHRQQWDTQQLQPIKIELPKIEQPKITLPNIQQPKIEQLKITLPNIQQPQIGQLKIDRVAPIADHGALLKFGTALSTGLTLSGRIDVAQLEQHTASAIGDTAGGLAVQTALDAAGSGGQMAGAALTVASAGLKMWDVWRVGSGQASPETIRHIIPHAVMAWESLRGPINLPSQNFHTEFRGTYQEPGLQMQTSGYVREARTFSSTAPRALAAFGYDGYTDSMIRTFESYSETRTVMNGRDWQNYLNDPQGIGGLSPSSGPNVLVWQTYSQVTPSGMYIPLGPPRVSPMVPTSTAGTISSWTTTPQSTWQQLPTYNPPTLNNHTIPMRTYTPPPRIQSPPSFRNW